MPLVEVVTIEIGSAIAKSLLKLWLKDSWWGDNVSSSLIDILKSQTSDRLAQRQGNRQFEMIGEQVGKNLLPLFEAEGIHLDEGDRVQVAEAVAKTFDRSKLSSELLTQRNLEPIQLAQYMLATNPWATEGFSEAATSLYQRIIKESCTYIVDIASQLPVFTEHSFAEVLKREDHIIAIAKDILESLRKMREQLDPMIEAEHFEIEYRQAIARNLDILQLIGTDVSLVNRRHRLSVAYITLLVEQKLSPSLDIIKASSVRIKDEAKRDIVSVDTTLARTRRLLIYGPAGSGKTTLLQWIAVQAATKSFAGNLADWNTHLPFYIRLRYCLPLGLPRPEAFPGLVASAIADTMPKGWAHAILKLGRALILIDGIDEVPASQREEVHTWLNDLVGTYKDACFIITSRPHAIEDGWMNHEAFSSAELQPMELADIYTFIDHWHQAVCEELHTDEEKNELAPLATHLKEHVKWNRPIRVLATSPLLCAILCALNRDRRRHLPINRIELYRACCSLLLDRRDKERRVDLTNYPVLTLSQKERILQDLAYWMMQRNLSEIEVIDVDERFTHQLAQMPGISPDITSMAVRRLFVERAGIIREPVANKIDFTHRTFEEFFAAQAVLDMTAIETLVANAHDDQWREVIILASGLASKTMCERLIGDLITRGDDEKECRYQLHLLAVACLETVIQLGPEIRTKVEKRLGQLVPPKNMTDAKAVAAAGELAVKHLEKKNNFSDATCAACIHALALIGGDVALDMLEQYTNDVDDVVIQELLKAWDLFDREVYARQVLSKALRHTSTLHLDRLPSLDGIQYFVSLTSLSLVGCHHLNTAHLTGLTNLTSLSLDSCDQLSTIHLTGLINLTSLSLAGCRQLSTIHLTDSTHLISLNLAYCRLLNIVHLTGLTKLASLSLAGCHQLSDLSPLTSLTNLTSLDLASCRQLSNLSPLISLTNLTSLDLHDCHQISSLSPLANLTNLASLNLSYCHRLSNLSPLTSLTNLTSLSLTGCHQISNLSPLTSLTNLTSLDLSHCEQLSTIHLTGLTNLTSLSLAGCHQLHTVHLTGLINLTSLSLAGCHLLSDLSPLANLTSLTSLDLSYCERLSDLSPLANLTNLASLSLAGCRQLSDLSPLVNLTNLTSLDLHGCYGISSLSPLANLTNLASLDLSYCHQLSDLSPLASLSYLKLIK